MWSTSQRRGRESGQEEGSGRHDSSLEAADTGVGGTEVRIFSRVQPQSLGWKGRGWSQGDGAWEREELTRGGQGDLRIHSLWSSAGDACEGVKKLWSV